MYDDQVGQFSEDEIRSSPIIQLCNTQSKSVQTFQTEFSYLRDICGGNIFTLELKKVASKKQQYVTTYELQKKAYNFLKEVTNGKKNSDEIQKITNPIYVKPRGRPPQKHYKSSLE
ncbi:hypothetical protein GLOIN_2v1472538 [Rhizophagus clarus]|uniref:Uncharacterized protein n=1 Tax=Rhizophagus clarus TaxID=94130 RepID=A0A8H3QF97_9GLOM|nr:hypothetical protein GLOIN_2v1472538 [Rhizophagus clarus]